MHLEHAPATTPSSAKTTSVQHIVMTFAEAYLSTAEHVSKGDFRVLRAVASCGTSAMGGHVMRCNACAFSKIAYNACRSRHCPVCSQAQSANWLAARVAELLPVDYLHLVFKLPSCLYGLALRNKKVVYETLFAATWASLKAQGDDGNLLGAMLGALAVLHTWTETMAFDPHLHVLVPVGGLSKNQESWVEPKPGFLTADTLDVRFRSELVQRLRARYSRGDLRLQGKTGDLEDVAAFEALMREVESATGRVYSKPPYESAARTLAYLAPGRGAPIANARILEVSASEVTIALRAEEGGEARHLTMTGVEFIRRFLRHTLPKSAPRIRYYGLLGCRNRAARLKRCRELLGVQVTAERGDGAKAVAEAAMGSGDDDGEPCPSCAVGRLKRGEKTTRALLWFRAPGRPRVDEPEANSKQSWLELMPVARTYVLRREG